MSFSGNVKRELAHAQPICENCRHAALYGMFLCQRGTDSGTVLFHSEHRAVAEYYASAASELTGARISVRSAGENAPHRKKIYQAVAEREKDARALRIRLGSAQERPPVAIDRSVIGRECCIHAFLRGAFMACGSVTDPEKEYHLELVPGSADLSKEIASLSEECGISFRETSRKGTPVLYLKESEPIEEILTLMGAMNATLELMNVKILKDVRNKVNRVTNCETANIEKTVNASSVQIGQIRLIERMIGIEELPEDLRELARIRLENPEMSLRELGSSLSEPISRSGVNHRLKRLAGIAEQLKTNGKTGANNV